MLSAVTAYGAWSAYATRADLLDARISAEQLQTALSTQDAVAAKRALRTMQEHFSAAHDRTDGPMWGMASKLPVIGDDARAVRTVAAVGDDLVEGTIAELVDEAGEGLKGRLVPRNGRIDIGEIEAIRPVVLRAHRNLNEAAGRLNSVDSNSLTRWVRPSYETFVEKVRGADTALSAADRAVRVLPTMLGKNEPRTYLVLFDNNAEIRATGGLPGAYSVIKANRGRLTLERQGAPADVGKFQRPVLPQSMAERQIYYGQIAEYFQDTNFTPEFPRTAELVREMWSRKQNQRVDGVLSLDTVTMSYLLRATGPIEAPGGVRLTSKNATRELLNNVYFRLPDGVQQDAFFRQVARLLFDEIIQGVESTSELVGAVGQGAREGRVYVHDFDPAVQRSLTGSAVAGEISGGDPRVPEVGVYLNDATGSKMSYYLRTRVRLRSESCVAGEQQLEASADLSYPKQSPPLKDLNNFVTGPGTLGTPKGEQLVLIRIYGPRGGRVSNFRFAGVPTQVEAIDDRSRPVVSGAVQLRRGETIRVSWRVHTGPEQDRHVRLAVSPGLTATPAVTFVDSACGM